jgi:hypothetical protein
MRIFHALLLAFLTGLSSFVFAQSTIVKGIVVNDAGEPLSGISISVKNSEHVSRTDSTGAFTIQIIDLPATLIFTGVGFHQQEYIIKEKKVDQSIKVTLHESSSALAEVVVVGYGTARKGSIALGGLSGRAAGISVRGSHRETGKVLRKTTPLLGNRTPGSKILTAGELSDFKKWKLWSDYTESEFRSWSDHWGMAPKKRYCVQVQNSDHKALVGEKVYLVNYHTRDTIWYTVTDNTGKAELWADLYQQADDQSVYTIICAGQVIRYPSTFENGINRITIKKTCNTSGLVDVAFVVDATGSMGDEIQYLQEELQDVISKTSEKYKDVNLHIGSVFYRDHGDEYLTRHVDFQTDPLQLINFFKKQSAGGGGDTPEAVGDALTTAFDSLHWHDAARTRILFLVLDAPPHDAAKSKMMELTRKAAQKGIRIVPVVCSGIDKSTEYLMRAMALATNGSYVFLTDDSGVGNAHIKPTTDEFKVELLNDLLQRLIGEMIYVASCDQKEVTDQPLPGLVDNRSKIIVFPNPTKGRVHIQSSSSFKEMFITDFTGKLLMKKEVSNKKGKWELDLSPYPSGTYLVKCFREDKGWEAEKVILMH